jgi:lysozyme
MKTSQAGLGLIKQFEGLRLKPYLCSAGVATIGYGSTMYADGRKVTLKDAAITESQAIELLANTLGKYEKAVNDYVKVPLTQNEFDALVSFTYNLGAGNLLSSTLLKKLNAGDKAGAANQFEVWNKAGGKVLQGLVTRRAAEKALFLKP